jgi:hypothetical protein
VAVAGQALVDQIEIGFGAVLETNAVGAQLVDGREDVVGGERDMLDAFALILAQELLDLAVLVLDSFSGIRILSSVPSSRVKASAVCFPSMSK